MTLIAAGVPERQAWQFVNQHGLDTPQAARQWADSWGRVDWSQNIGPDGNVVPAPAAAAPPAADPDAVGADGRTDAQRRSARDTIFAAFEQYGVGGDLAGQIYSWMTEGRSDAQIGMDIRNTDAYKARFPGMAAMASRGQAIDERTYVAQEAAYMSAMRSAGLPQGFMDSREDIGRLFENGVSVNEFEDRVDNVRRRWQAAPPELQAQLKEYYGVSASEAMAWMLDPTKAQSFLQEAQRKLEIGAAASTAGIALGEKAASRISLLAGAQGIDSLSGAGVAQIQERIGYAGRLDQADSRLAGIDNEAYSAEDAVSAAFGDQTASLASEQRAKREQARFSGSSGLTRDSLSRRRTAD